MTKKLTKKQRIKALTDSGMTRVEAEFQIAEEDLAEQNQRIEDTALGIIKRDHAEVWELVVEEARDVVVRPSRRRKKESEGASHDTATGASVPVSTDAETSPTYPQQSDFSM
ncbi:hypothetical protein ACTXPP_11395 [Candidatus Corynebacterium faecigallinarum]|uniref:hypothetical protein n=1 Tax=Candidatus Corynebacterium faecigallinarum TaxID=2838528 RepID=UPI003FD07BAE